MDLTTQFELILFSYFFSILFMIFFDLFNHLFYKKKSTLIRLFFETIFFLGFTFIFFIFQLKISSGIFNINIIFFLLLGMISYIFFLHYYFIKFYNDITLKIKEKKLSIRLSYQKKYDKIKKEKVEKKNEKNKRTKRSNS